MLYDTVLQVILYSNTVGEPFPSLLAYRSPVNAELGYKVHPWHQILLFRPLLDLLNTVPLTSSPLHVKITPDGYAYPARSRTV
jgi:hypothetical protein